MTATDCQLITMKTRTTILALLLPLIVAAAEPAATQAPPNIEESLRAAARAGDAAGIMRGILNSYERGGSFDKTSAKELLDGLVRGGELPAFTVLLSELRKTYTGKDWQPDDALLAEVIRGGRKDFIDVMLASWLDPARLEGKRDAGDAAMAEWMTRRVAEVRKQRADQDELVAAAGKGDVETMRRLLDVGVDVNCVATSAHTPLTFAAVKSQIEAVRLLLERGAAVDQPKHPGWDYTPLCLTKSVEIAKLLKAHGANVHAKLFKRDVSILTYIARWGGADMVEWMLKQGLDPKMIGDNKQNLLFDAGDARTAELLLAAGVDPNHVDEFGRTPLASAQNGEIARTLIAAGAKIEADDTLIKGMVYQHASADAIEAVIKARGKLDPAAAQMALIAAAHIDQAETAKLLLKHGAKANEMGKWGLSNDFDILPLMECTVHGSPKTAKVLLEHGADPNAGETPGDLLRNAIRNGYADVAKILREAGAKGVSDLAFYIAVKDEAKVQELLQAAPSFAEKPEFWAAALPAAARTGELACVRAAIEKGVPLAPKPVKPANPVENAFDAAASEGQHEVLAVLLDHRGKSEDASDLRQSLWNAVWNSNPYAEQRPAEAFEKCVKLLLDAGALRADNAEQDALVQYAVFTRNPGGNPKVVEMLVAAGADPNPLLSGDKDTPWRLSDVIQGACTQQGCSTPFARTIAVVEKAAKIVIKR
jgi:ankyrin repeat protein